MILVIRHFAHQTKDLHKNLQAKASFFKLCEGLVMAAECLESLKTMEPNKTPGTIVNRGKWLGGPLNIKEVNKQSKIYVGRSLTL